MAAGVAGPEKRERRARRTVVLFEGWDQKFESLFLRGRVSDELMELDATVGRHVRISQQLALRCCVMAGPVLHGPRPAEQHYHWRAQQYQRNCRR